MNDLYYSENKAPVVKQMPIGHKISKDIARSVQDLGFHLSLEILKEFNLRFRQKRVLSEDDMKELMLNFNQHNTSEFTAKQICARIVSQILQQYGKDNRPKFQDLIDWLKDAKEIEASTILSEIQQEWTVTLLKIQKINSELEKIELQCDKLTAEKGEIDLEQNGTFTKQMLQILQERILAGELNVTPFIEKAKTQESVDKPLLTPEQQAMMSYIPLARHHQVQKEKLEKQYFNEIQKLKTGSSEELEKLNQSSEKKTMALLLSQTEAMKTLAASLKKSQKKQWAQERQEQQHQAKDSQKQFLEEIKPKNLTKPEKLEQEKIVKDKLQEEFDKRDKIKQEEFKNESFHKTVELKLQQLETYHNQEVKQLTDIQSFNVASLEKQCAQKEAQLTGMHKLYLAQILEQFTEDSEYQLKEQKKQGQMTLKKVSKGSKTATQQFEKYSEAELRENRKYVRQSSKTLSAEELSGLKQRYEQNHLGQKEEFFTTQQNEQSKTLKSMENLHSDARRSLQKRFDTQIANMNLSFECLTQSVQTEFFGKITKLKASNAKEQEQIENKFEAIKTDLLKAQQGK